MNAEKVKQITSFVNNEQVNQENHWVKRKILLKNHRIFVRDSATASRRLVSGVQFVIIWTAGSSSSKKGMKIGWVKMFAKIQKYDWKSTWAPPPSMRIDMKQIAKINRSAIVALESRCFRTFFFFAGNKTENDERYQKS